VLDRAEQAVQSYSPTLSRAKHFTKRQPALLDSTQSDKLMVVGIYRSLRWARLEMLGLNKHPRRLLAPNPLLSPHRFSLSATRIRALQRRLNLDGSYLEIGVSSGFTFETVRGDLRVGVDPFPRFDYFSLPPKTRFFPVKSREFFDLGYHDLSFDFVFLDGLHTAIATYFDLLGTLQLLDEGGAILIDDVLPIDEASSLPSEEEARDAQASQLIAHGGWYGDVWRLASLLLTTKSKFRYILIGDGRSEHSQLLIQPLAGFVDEFVPDKDLEKMSKMSFHDSVEMGDHCLTRLAVPEFQAFRELKDW